MPTSCPPWDVTTSAPAGDYAVDQQLPNPGPPGSGEHADNPALEGWYDYDPATHATTPKPVVFLAHGGHAKLQIHRDVPSAARAAAVSRAGVASVPSAPRAAPCAILLRDAIRVPAQARKA